MKIVNGDLIQLAQLGHFDVIVHGCNCFCTMGAGIAKGIKSAFPAAFQADQLTTKGDKSKLGRWSSATVTTEHGQLTIINAYTQFHWRGQGIKVDYDAMRLVFQKLQLQFADKRIGLPQIGAGLAGGDWSVISRIIDEELAGADVTLVKFSK